MSLFSCIHCPATFEPSTHNGAVILGQSPQEKILDCLNQAGAHIATMHPEIHIELALRVADMGMVGMMSHLKTDLPGATENFQMMCARIARAVMRPLTDESIRDRVEQWAKDQWTGGDNYARPFITSVESLLKLQRNYLLYRDVFEPVPQTQPLNQGVNS